MTQVVKKRKIMNGNMSVNVTASVIVAIAEARTKKRKKTAEKKDVAEVVPKEGHARNPNNIT